MSVDSNKLYITKSFVSTSLTRKMVEFMTEILDLNGFITQLEATSKYSMDELFVSSINSNDQLNAPGGFTKACLDRGFPVDGLTRLLVLKLFSLNGIHLNK